MWFISPLLEDCHLQAEFYPKALCSYTSLFAARSLRNKFNTNGARSLSLFLYMLSQKCALFAGKIHQKQDQLESMDARLPSGQIQHSLPNHNINTWLDFCTFQNDLNYQTENLMLFQNGINKTEFEVKVWQIVTEKLNSLVFIIKFQC